jgi:transposase
MSALATRAYVQACGQYYLMPLAQVGETAVLMADWIADGVAQAESLKQVQRIDGEQVIAQGYEVRRTCQQEGQAWQERVLIVRSLTHAQTLCRHLEERLTKAEAALQSLTPAVGRGKRQIREETVLQSAVEAVLRTYHVEGLLIWGYERQVEQEMKWVGRGRGGAKRKQEVVEHIRYQITAVRRDQEAIAAQMTTLGWRAYATNAPEPRLSLEQAVQEYRQEYHVERGFGRLKGAPLSIAPLFVQRDDQVVGLTHLLSLALRVLTLMEFVVRRRLKQQGTVLVGLSKESLRKTTSTPTAERLLQAFVPMTLTTVQLPGHTVRHVAALSPVQAQILQLLGLPADLYACLAREIPQTAFPLRE